MMYERSVGITSDEQQVRLPSRVDASDKRDRDPFVHRYTVMFVVSCVRFVMASVSSYQRWRRDRNAYQTMNIDVKRTLCRGEKEEQRK
jgi:hypothetical protein